MTEERKPYREVLPTVRRLLGSLTFRRLDIIAISILIVLAAAVPLAIPWLIGRVFDQAILGSGSTQTREELLYTLVAGVAVAEIAVLAFHIMKDSGTHKMSERLLLDLRVKVFSRLQILSPIWHAEQQVGAMASRVLDDTREVESLFKDCIAAMLLGPLGFFGVAVVLILMNPVLAALALAPAPFLFGALWIFVQGMRNTARGVRDHEERLSAALHESLEGHSVITRHNRQGYETDRFRAHGEMLKKWRLKRVRLITRYYPLMGFLTSAGTVIILAMGGGASITGTLTPGELVAFLGYLAFLYVPILQMTRANHLLQNVSNSASRLFEILDAQSDPAEPEDPEMMEVERGLEMDNVWYSYPDKPILRGVYLNLEPGDTLGLVGPTGTGKSTLASLLIRFRDVQEGMIKVGGVDIRKLRLRDVRNAVGIVMQDEFMFNDTIRANLLYARPRALDEEVKRACQDAALLEAIEDFPGGFETVVGERGVRMSQGERQRLAIARALLAEPSILILDEATSSLDEETEHRVLNGVFSAMEGKTLVVISHRTGPINRCDRVFKLEDGRLSIVRAEDRSEEPTTT